LLAADRTQNPPQSRSSWGRSMSTTSTATDFPTFSRRRRETLSSRTRPTRAPSCKTAASSSTSRKVSTRVGTPCFRRCQSRWRQPPSMCRTSIPATSTMTGWLTSSPGTGALASGSTACTTSRTAMMTTTRSLGIRTSAASHRRLRLNSESRMNSTGSSRLLPRISTAMDTTTLCRRPDLTTASSGSRTPMAVARMSWSRRVQFLPSRLRSRPSAVLAAHGVSMSRISMVTAISMWSAPTVTMTISRCFRMTALPFRRSNRASRLTSWAILLPSSRRTLTAIATSILPARPETATPFDGTKRSRWWTRQRWQSSAHYRSRSSKQRPAIPCLRGKHTSPAPVSQSSILLANRSPSRAGTSLHSQACSSEAL